MLYRPKVYFASKVRHAPMWRDMRAGRLAFCEIVSEWIDDPGLIAEASGTVAPSARCAEVWTMDIRQAKLADFIFAYAEAEDIPRLSGTLVEIGAGLASSAVVLLSGGHWPSVWTWIHHPRCIIFNGVFPDEAIALIKRTHEAAKRGER